MAKVLLYNIEKGKAVKIKMLCRKFFIDAEEVAKADFGKKISVLLGLTEDGGETESADFSEEVLYFADINSAFLSILLNQLKRKKVSVALKAVKTETNVNYTSYQLYKELSAEREAIAQGKTVRKESR